MFTELIYHDAVIENLNNLIRTTIKINNKLYQLQITTRLSRTSEYYYSRSAGHYIIKKNHKPSSTQYRDLINLNIIQKKKTSKKKISRKKPRNTTITIKQDT